MKHFLSSLTVLLMISLLVGCGHFRYVATSKTQPTGGVRTQNRYCLFQFCVKQNGKYANMDNREFSAAWATFKSTLPNVFSDDGKPIAVYLEYTDGRDSKYGWTFLFPYLLTVGIFPMWNHYEWTAHYTIRFKNPKNVSGGLRNAYAVKIERDWNMSCYGPIALCIPYGTPVAGEDGQPFFHRQTHAFGSKNSAANRVVVHAAIAYGAACTLKQMEEDGSLPEVWEDESVDPGAVKTIPSALDGPKGRGDESGVLELDAIPL